MCPVANSTTASSSPLASTGRSLLSRLTSPLKSRTRNLTDFYIRPLEPHRQYSPGDLVKGAVVLTVVKPIRLTHLTVCLHGFVRVFKHANGANDPLPVEAGLTVGSNPKKSQYFGNGHASLFQDEVTLCGEGRLDAGVYEFNFELEFPSKGLPTSIDFERGTISYMITSTITRPTSIAATSSCDQKISLVETVDIGPMKPPKPRTISLEPISRRSRRRKTGKNKETIAQEATDAGSGSETARMAGSPLPDDSASQCGSVDQNNNPRSPVASDIQSTVSTATSTESTASDSAGLSFRLDHVPSSARSAGLSQRTGSKVSLPIKTITATIELLKSGCLPGDNLPLKITIKHNKAIKSMHGIIITLYRQGRIDSAPPLSLFTDIKGKAAEQLKHEEYYPKSKTGLGGLSLTSAGSNSLFRKDLAQTFAPLLVDPVTLSAVVTASVRVPEDVFPTITGIPGQMISFRYHVEVVMDLGGKLAGQQRHLPRVGAVTLPSIYGTSTNGGNANMLAAWGGSIVDTDHVRREKGVVACLFEVVVGTTDSARKRGRGNSTVNKRMNGQPEETPATPITPHEFTRESSVTRNGEEQYKEDEQHYHQYNNQHYEEQYSGHYAAWEGYHYEQDYEWYPEQYPPPAHAQIYVPPPEVQADEGLSEKERVRRAEERLLPSQPPEDRQGPSSPRTIVQPPAPSAPPDEQDDLYSADDAIPQGPLNSSRLLSHAGAFSDPALEDLATASADHPIEDKQELERRRMLAEASAPSDVLGGEDDNAAEGSSGAQHEPSAPVLTEEDEYGEQYAHHSIPGPSTEHESLPKYER